MSLKAVIQYSTTLAL